MTCAEVLPSEIWGKVLEKLNDVKDRLNLIESFSLDDVFADRKVGWMFAATLPIIIKQLDHHHSDLVLSNALFACRLVSKDCLKGVDKYIDEFYDGDSDPKSGTLEPLIFPKSKPFISPMAICDFFDLIKHNSLEHCPITTKFAAFWCEYNLDQAMSTYVEIIGLLERIGPLLRSVLLIIVNFPSPRSLNEYLGKVLPLLPNVRYLLIVVGRVEDEEIPLETPEQQLESIVFSNLPHLNFLYVMPMEQIMPIPREIRFQGYFPQVKRLQLDFNMWIDDFNGDKGLFVNLQNLSLKFVHVDRPEIVDKLISFFRNLEAPQLSVILVDMEVSWDGDVKLGKENMQFVEKMGLYFLSRKETSVTKKWKGTCAVLFALPGICTAMRMKLFDSNKLMIPPLKPLEVIKLQNPNQGGGMCTII